MLDRRRIGERVGLSLVPRALWRNRRASVFAICLINRLTKDSRVECPIGLILALGMTVPLLADEPTASSAAEAAGAPRASGFLLLV